MAQGGWTDGGTTVRLTTIGDVVGVGTTTVGSKMQVNGSAAVGYSASTAAPSNGLAVSGNTGIGTTTVGSRLQVNGNSAIGYSASTAAPANGLAVAGQVGIGVTSPQSQLDVEGGVTIGATYSGTNAAPTNGLLVENWVLIGRTTPRVEWTDMVNVQGGAFVVTDGIIDNIMMINGNGGVVGTRTNHEFRVLTNATPRIWVAPSGNVEIGSVGAADEKLHVRGNIKANGKIMADSVVINGNWVIKAPDYVFSNTYKLRSLDQVESLVKQNKHLPGVPSAQEMQNHGVNVGDLNMALLKKVEELTLYVIEQQKQISELKARMDVR